MLQQYCESLNIKFIWSFWEDYYSDVFLRITEIINKYKSDEDLLKNYCIVNLNTWKLIGEKNDQIDIYTGSIKECHKEFNKHPLFHIAADRSWEQPGLHALQPVSEEFAHWGIHRHLHIAEVFDEKFKTIL